MPLAFPTSLQKRQIRYWDFANSTGQNTKQGGLLVFKLKGSNKSFTTDEDVREIFAHMISESVLELKETGSVLYE